MQLTVKTLKGEKFTIEVEESHTIAQVKDIIEQQKSELVAESMKLIHSGKVLKDSETIADCQIQPNAFLVVMVSKKKKPVAAVAAALDVASNDSDSKPVAESKLSSTETGSTGVTTTTTSSTTATTTTNMATPSTPAALPSTSSSTASAPLAPLRNRTAPASSTTTPGNDHDASIDAAAAAAAEEDASVDVNDNDMLLPPEAVSNLTAMGFPEAEVKACLRVAGGNPDLAVEFLMNGIPEHVAAAVAAGGGRNATAAVGRPPQGQPLEQLRNHPQIDQLRQLVQSNPAMLQAVLTQIGQQQPELLQEINLHQELFLQIMNEPVGTTSGGDGSGSSSGGGGAVAGTSSGTAGSGSDTDIPLGPGGLTAEMMQGLGNPAQLAQMIDSMTPEQLQSMSAMMGLTPDQLRMTAQAISRMPPEELQNYMNMAMEGMDDEGGIASGGMGQGRGMGAGAGGGSQYVTLTDEELAAVERLTAMGFDRMEAVQAYLACDKNEELAANLLMDGGFGFGFGNDEGMGGGHEDEDDGDDMYD